MPMPMAPSRSGTTPTPTLGQSINDASALALGGPGPSTTANAGRGLKGFFSRNRMTSPEPPESSTRSRLRAFVNDVREGGSTFKPGRKTTVKPVPVKTASRISMKREPPDRSLQPQADQRPRHLSPEPPARSKIRFAASLLPAIQKGEDGRWQPPSLSRGSMSTSGLALYQDDGDAVQSEVQENKRIEGDGLEKSMALGDLFVSGELAANPAPATPSQRPSPTKHAAPVVPDKTPRNTLQPASDEEPLASRRVTLSPPRTPTARSAGRVTMLPDSPMSDLPPLPFPRAPAGSPRVTRAHSETIQPSPDRQRHNPAEQNKIGNAISLSPDRSTSAPHQPLSADHYHLRLATSFLVKTLTPVVKGSGFVQNEKNAEMRRLADERLTALGRMEKAWGVDWLKAAGTLGTTAFDADGGAGATATATAADSSAAGLEAKVRAVHVGEGARLRERRAFANAIKDGILLCFLLNHLFPAQPPHIPRLNISEDGILRATNVTRFITACQTIGLPDQDIFNLAEVNEASETSLGSVAMTIVTLARLAAKQGNERAEARKSSPAKSPGRAAPKGSPRVSLDSKSPPTPAHSSAPDLYEGHREVQARLQPIADPLPMIPVGAAEATEPANVTPTNSTFTNLPITPQSATGPIALLPRQPMHRSNTQPSISPTSLRPKSPPPAFPSRSGTPTKQGVRPTLRPRYTTGSKISVSFADSHIPPTPVTASDNRIDLPPANARGLHSKERTPSLISSGSRVISGYTRSSAAFSIATVVGDGLEDNTTGVAVVNHDYPSIGLRGGAQRERRYSEKALHEARRRMLDTLHQEDPTTIQNDWPALSEEIHGDDEARNQALSLSLAALEGTRSTPYQPSITTSSPGRSRSRSRHGCEIGATTSTGRQEVSRVLEEDELSGSSSQEREPGEQPSSAPEPRPSILRRADSTGNRDVRSGGNPVVYVPNRSTSPASFAAGAQSSPTSAAFRLSNTNLPIAVPILRSRTLSAETSNIIIPAGGPTAAVPIQMERGRSEQNSVYRSAFARSVISLHHGEDGVGTRMNSQVNLNLSSSVSSQPPSILRESMTAGMLRDKASQPLPLLVIEFTEQGQAPVKYQLGNCIGRGQFGSVYRSLNLSTGQMVAIKRIDLRGMAENEVRDVMKEVNVLKSLRHPSIVKYEGMKRDEEYLNIVLEFVENGSLGQTLKAFGKFNEKLVASYVARILEGLDYLHSQGVVHCDLKAANILSTKNGNVKLSDFGVSLNMKAVENIKVEVMTASKNGGKVGLSEVAGTPHWMAPEVIELNGASFASDIWSLGCTIIELLTGKPPYADISNGMTVLFRIVEDETPPLPSAISDDLVDFLRLCFIKNPRLRPTAAVLFEHPWLRNHNPELSTLRPQDSVPFLRRVSADMQRLDSTRLFTESTPSLAVPELAAPVPVRQYSSPVPGASAIYGSGAFDANGWRRSSFAGSSHSGAGVSKVHSLIKTSFGKAIICRVCHTAVKKSGVLCQDCGLLCHTTCVSKASKLCDPHGQIAHYARQIEGLHAQSHTPTPSALTSVFPSRVSSPRNSTLYLERDHGEDGHTGGHPELMKGKGNLWQKSKAILVEGYLAPSPGALCVTRQRTTSHASTQVSRSSTDIDGNTRARKSISSDVERVTHQNNGEQTARTQGSEESGSGGQAKRSSMIRFDLEVKHLHEHDLKDDRDHGSEALLAGGEEVLERKMTAAVIPAGGGGGSTEHGHAGDQSRPGLQQTRRGSHGHTKSRDSKSDCLVM